MLSSLGWLYGKIINKRNSLYKKGSLKSRSLGVPTISVGNITVGGTGKTPLVAYIVNVLAEKGETVCVISRGYKRENENERVLVSNRQEILVDARKGGDEPLELAKQLLGKAYVIADANRVEAGMWAKKEFGITAFVLDDAFQHQKVKRDLDIVTIDATNPFGNGKTLPAGILREPLENLERADLFVITRSNLIDDLTDLRTQIREHAKTQPILISHNETAKLVQINGLIESELSEHQTYFAFCALGNPNNFFDQLVREKYEIVGIKQFPDHYSYTKDDIQTLENSAKESGAKAFITTAKDAVKLTNIDFSIPCCVSETKLVFNDEKKLHETIHAVFNV